MLTGKVSPQIGWYPSTGLFIMLMLGCLRCRLRFSNLFLYIFQWAPLFDQVTLAHGTWNFMCPDHCGISTFVCLRMVMLSWWKLIVPLSWQLVMFKFNRLKWGSSSRLLAQLLSRKIWFCFFVIFLRNLRGLAHKVLVVSCWFLLIKKMVKC